MNLILIVAQLKALATIRLYVDAFAAIVSVLNFTQLKSIDLCLFLFSLSLISSQILIGLHLSINIYRTIILCCMLVLAALVIKLRFSYSIPKLISYSIIINTIFVLLELVLIQYVDIHIDYSKYFGIRIPRLTGTIGEPNYFGYFCLLLFVLLERKCSISGVILLGMIFISGSRGAMLSIILWPLLATLSILPLRAFILNMICLLMPLSPLMIYGLLQSLEHEVLVILNALSSTRLEIWEQLLEAVYAYPFGVGYFQSTKFVGAYETMFALRAAHMQPHNTWFQILAEFGTVSYLISIALYMTISFKLTCQRKLFFIVAVLPLQFLHITGSFLMVVLFLVLKVLVDREKLARNGNLN